MSYIKFLREHVGHEAILTAGTVLFIINEDNEILMQLRSDFNQWGFPGGAMELGESFEETARRELKEETNLDIIDMELIEVMSGKDTYREYPNGDKLYDISALYKVTKTDGKLRVNDEESKKFGWFKLDDIPSNLAPMSIKYWNKVKDRLGVK